MEELLLILMMILIGAIIGGVTNSLAIKMLFRPHQPKYIGNWKLPLTPGLIPKRRDELAKQLGRMVVEHLLTPIGIKKKLDQPDFRLQLTNWAQQEVKRILNQDIAIKHLLAQVGIYLDEQTIRTVIAKYSQNQYEQMMQSKRNLPLKELVEQIPIDTGHGINQATSYIQQQLSTYLASQEANTKMAELIESYLSGKGFLGNMITSFVGHRGLADHMQPVLVEFTRSQDAKDLLNQLLTQEFERFSDQPIGSVEAKIGADVIGQTIGTIVSLSLPVEGWLSKSVKEWASPFQEQILSHIVPTIITKVVDQLGVQIEPMLKQLQLEDIVEKEVASFPIERVEQLVLAISKREFKLITYLGALLGGIIGLIQGIIVVLIG